MVHALLFLVGDNLPKKKADEAKEADKSETKEVKMVTIEFDIEDARPPDPEPQDVPLEFVWVDPMSSAEEPPKETKRYSFASTKASNPSPDIDTGKAKIDGIQDKVLQTYDAPREKPMPLQPLLKEPQPEPEQPKEQPQELVKAPEKPKVPPKPETKPAQMAKKAPEGNTRPKPEPKTKMTASPAEPAPQAEREPKPKPTPPRPRTLAQAKAQIAKPASQAMKQDGGVKRKSEIAMVDAQGSEFGRYDQQLIDAIRHRWWDILDDHPTSLRAGRVVIEFRLHDDGRVSDVRQAESSVGYLQGYLCERAVSEPAPYPRWPESMRLLVNSGARDIKFIFKY